MEVKNSKMLLNPREIGLNLLLWYLTSVAWFRRQLHSSSCIGATQGIKTMSAARKPKRDRVRRAIWPRGVTHCVYNDRRAHAGEGGGDTDAHARTYTCSVGFWILPRLSAVHVQELPTHHVRTKECRRLCRPRYLAVGRFASPNSPCKITTEQIRARSSAKTLVPPDRNYERSLKRCWWYDIINIAAMLTRGEIVGIRRKHLN